MSWKSACRTFDYNQIVSKIYYQDFWDVYAEGCRLMDMIIFDNVNVHPSIVILFVKVVVEWLQKGVPNVDEDMIHVDCKNLFSHFFHYGCKFKIKQIICLVGRSYLCLDDGIEEVLKSNDYSFLNWLIKVERFKLNAKNLSVVYIYNQSLYDALLKDMTYFQNNLFLDACLEGFVPLVSHMLSSQKPQDIIRGMMFLTHGYFSRRGGSLETFKLLMEHCDYENFKSNFSFSFAIGFLVRRGLVDLLKYIYNVLKPSDRETHFNTMISIDDTYFHGNCNQILECLMFLVETNWKFHVHFKEIRDPVLISKILNNGVPFYFFGDNPFMETIQKHKQNVVSFLDNILEMFLSKDICIHCISQYVNYCHKIH